MSAYLFVEVSHDTYTGRGGWGAVLRGELGEETLQGQLPTAFSSIVIAELAAIHEAFSVAQARGMIPSFDDLKIITRSTATASALRWMFPKAPFDGVIDAPPVKRPGRSLRAAEFLFDFSDEVERAGVNLSLAHVSEDTATLKAFHLARLEMERGRSPRRAHAPYRR